MVFNERVTSLPVRLGASTLLALGLLAEVPSAMAEATNRIIAVGDFGSNKGANDEPDGLDDLLWLDFPSGHIFIQYIDDNGVRVRNRIGAIDRIAVLSSGNGYFTDDRIVSDNPSSGGGQLEAQLNVTGPV